MNTTTWFVERDGSESGPHEISALASMVREGVLAPDSRVREHAGDWGVAGERLGELFVAPDSPPATGWTDRSPHPWRRYLARFVDNIVVGYITSGFIGIVAYSLAPQQADAFFTGLLTAPGGAVLDQVLTLMLAIPGNAAMIGFTGVSIGKWIFGVRVLRKGRPIGFAAALSREVEIWWRGLAFGVPLVTLFTLWASHERLTEKRVTPWDERQRNTVTHRPESGVATVAMWLVGMAAFGAAILSRIAPPPS